jgi:two-component sensor histidine kinase
VLQNGTPTLPGDGGPAVRYADGRPYDIRDTAALFQSCEQPPHEHEPAELIFAWADGERRQVLQNAGPICDEHGRLTGTVIIFQDITQQHLMRGELQRRATQLETLIREAHHRIRNNLQSVSSFLEVERMRMAPSEDTGPLDRCVSRIQAISVVHRLLTAEATNDVPLMALLKRLSELANATAVGHNRPAVEIALSGPEMRVDSKKATSVAIAVNELMANAIEHAFGPQGPGRITVSVAHDAAEDAVEVTVADNGLGFRPDAPEGTGLTLARALVEHDIGGRFTVEADPAGGSRCHIRFSL